jgi:hypothetical protein
MNTSPNTHFPGVVKALREGGIAYGVIDAQSPEEMSLIEWTELAFPSVHSQIDWAKIPAHRCIDWNDLDDLVPFFLEMADTFHAGSPVVVMWANGLCPSVEMALGDVARIARAIFEEHETSLDVFVFNRHEGWLIEMNHEGTLCVGRSEAFKMK